MDSSNGTRHAPGARGGAHERVPAGIHPGQLSLLAGLPHLDGDGATAVRRFTQHAFAARVAARVDTTAPCSGAPAPCKTPVPYEHYSPVFYVHDESGFRVASPPRVIEQAQQLIASRFHRDGPLIDQPHVVRALLHVQLAAHPRAVFAALFLDRHLRLIDYAELFTGTTDDITVYPREMVREALERNSAAIVAARNDPTGEGTPSARDVADARRLQHALGKVDVRLLDYLVVGRTIASLAERGAV